MRIKNIMLSSLFALGVLSASAQEQQKGTTVYDFNPHWYVQIQPVGGQYTLGEVDFGDLFSYNVQAALGYNFSKVFGARLAVNAWQSKAGIKIDNSDFNIGDFKQTWKWTYFAPSLDLTINLTNLVCDYNPKRLFNLSAFLGVGANFASGNDDAQKAEQNLQAYLASSQNRAWSGDQNLRYLWDGSKTNIFGQAGLICDFRLSDVVSLNVEANANVLSDKYNSKKAGNADWYFNALAGVKVNLGKSYSSRFIPAPEPEIRYVEKVVEKVVEVPAKVEAAVVEPIRRDVFFKINSFKIQKTEEQKVKDIVDYMQKYPNSKVVVTGYADAGTGNDRINDRLAAQRADAVVKVLKGQYGIAADRITYDSKGARVQPFSENDKNRVTICIAE
ncbi:MAG: OmpA family protein [Prevotella sp.]|nr:OmpA family protein [Prevotella sp.]